MMTQMNTPTPRTDTPRTDAACDSHYHYCCADVARTMERELATITAERDQLRAEFEKIAVTSAQLADNNVSLRQERDQLRAELATERARMDDLVADLNDACITLASAKDDCDDYALLNTGFKLTAVRDVLLQYIPNAAMKEGAK